MCEITKQKQKQTNNKKIYNPPLLFSICLPCNLNKGDDLTEGEYGFTPITKPGMERCVITICDFSDAQYKRKNCVIDWYAARPM